MVNSRKKEEQLTSKYISYIFLQFITIYNILSEEGEESVYALSKLIKINWQCRWKCLQPDCCSNVVSSSYYWESDQISFHQIDDS